MSFVRNRWAGTGQGWVGRGATSLALLPLVVLSLASCDPPRIVKPVPTVSAVIGSDRAPLVVDWPSGHRSDLEVATRDGVAVIRVEPSGITLLRDCRLPGSYGFLGVSTKEQLIRLEDAADVAVSLPLRGAGLAAELGGSLGSSTALDVALVTVGRRRTTRAAAARSALRGSECAGATHFVRGFDVGAFVLATSEKNQASTVGGLFGVQASAARSKAKSVRESDGSLEACRGASPGDRTPPSQCGAALRLDLKALDEDEAVDAASCSSGLVRAAGKCTSASKAIERVTYECAPSNEAECREQCEAGDAPSCGHLAHLLRRSTSRRPDFKAIGEAAERGCAGGSERACVVLGELAQYGNGVAVDHKRADELYGRACAAGEASGCFHQGTLYDRRPGLPVDWAKASELYDRACRGGHADGCNNLGALALAGRGAPADPERARAIYEEACRNGSATACGNLGDLVAEGTGGPKDAVRAGELWEQGCARSGSHCLRLADATGGLGPLPRDAARSLDAYQRGLKLLSAHCALGLADRCDDLGWLFHDGRAVPRDDEQALTYIRKGCELGSPAACNHVGLFLERGWGVAPDRAEAKKKYTQACEAGNLHACVSQALLAPRAHRLKLLEPACEGGVAVGCFHLARAERLRLDDHKARPRLQEACRDGHAPACSYLGRWLARDKGPEATAMLETGCARGDLSGCASLAERLAAARAPGEQAESLARRACEGGVARGCRTLASLASQGRTTQVASSEVSALLQRACDGRDLSSCVALAEQVKAAEPGRAAGLLQRACDTNSYSPAELVTAARDLVSVKAAPVEPTSQAGLRVQEKGRISGLGSVDPTMSGGTAGGTAGGDRGDPMAQHREMMAEVQRHDLADADEVTSEVRAGCTSLGEMHEKGLGFVADAARAETLYSAACASGDGRGCSRLADLETRKKTRRKEWASLLQILACEFGSPEGCWQAGQPRASGRDDEQAFSLLEKGCALGDTRACEAADKLQKKRGFIRATTRRASSPVGPPKANVQYGPASVEGSLPGLHRTLARVQGKVKACYTQGLAESPEAEGRLQVRLEVTAEGKVRSAQVTAGAGLPAGVGKCVKAAFASASFDPAPGEPVEVTVPILLNSGE